MYCRGWFSVKYVHDFALVVQTWTWFLHYDSTKKILGTAKTTDCCIHWLGKGIRFGVSQSTVGDSPVTRLRLRRHGAIHYQRFLRPHSSPCPFAIAPWIKRRCICALVSELDARIGKAAFTFGKLRFRVWANQHLKVRSRSASMLLACSACYSAVVKPM